MHTTVKTTALSLALLLGATSAAHAAPKLYQPYVEQGEWELEYFGFRTNDGDPAKDHESKHQFSVGYGLTSWWRTELYGKLEREPQHNTTFDALEWENIFQFTERGEYWLDVGGSLAYEFTPKHSVADKIESRLMLAKDVGQTSHVLNIMLEKGVASGHKESVEAGLLWSSRYSLSEYFEPGFEISSEFGETRNTGNYDEQKHAIGPAAYGKVALPFTAANDALRYRVGYLFGVSKAAPDGDAFVQLEYELHF